MWANQNPQSVKTGALWAKHRLAPTAAPAAETRALAPPIKDPLRWAFGGLFIFTLLLFVRPNDLLPGVFGAFPFAKIVALFSISIYVFTRLARAQTISILPKELQMIGLMIFLALLLMPIALEPRRTLNILTDTFLKIVIVFMLMINLINTRERLRAFLKLLVFCGAAISLLGIKAYFSGALRADEGGDIRAGAEGGIFANPNELAMAVLMLLPLTLVLALNCRGKARLGYFALLLIQAFASIITFSRGGFLALVVMAAFLLLKFGRGKRLAAGLVAVLAAGIMLVAMPSGYSDRLLTIIHIEKDETGSAQERKALLERAVSLAVRNPIIGLGMDNYRLYSIRNRLSHNSFLEISAELGVIGLIAYLVIIFNPFFAMRRIERETSHAQTTSDREVYFLSIALQASLIVYVICSSLGSFQYFWYLYYIAGFAVAFRGVFAKEYATAPGGNFIPLSPRINKKPRGVLWQADRLKKGMGFQKS